MQSFVRAMEDLGRGSQVLFTSFKKEILGLNHLKAYLLEMERAGPGGEKCTKVKAIGVREAEDVLADVK
jgi:hypothetical protein